MIKPTVGRVVWFHPAVTSRSAYFSPSGVYAGIIAFVHSDNCVNLAVLNAKGVSYSRTSVPLIQDGEPAPERGFYCEWMPYQKQVAAGQIPPVLHALEPGASAGTGGPTSSSWPLITNPGQMVPLPFRMTRLKKIRATVKQASCLPSPAVKTYRTF